MTQAMDSNSWKPADTLAARVLLVRTELDMNRKQFAQFTGLTENQLQSIEGGRSPHQLAAKITRIVLATGVDRDWLMWGGPLGDGKPAPTGGDGAPSRDRTEDLSLIWSRGYQQKHGGNVHELRPRPAFSPVDLPAAS